MDQKIVKEGYVVITPTLCQGDTIAGSEVDESGVRPWIFDTVKDAQLEQLSILEDHIEQFKEGDREWDEIGFGLYEEYIARYVEYDDGKIIVYELPDEEGRDHGNIILETTLKEWRENR